MAYSTTKVALQGTCYWYRKKAKKESEVIEQKSQGKPFRSLQRSRILIRRENVTKHGRDIVGLVETEVSPND
jgi:hypothetical protein